MFAKMFQSEEVGQIVIMKDINDDQDPCIKIYFDPNIEGLSICNSIISFQKEESRDKAFDQIEIRHVEYSVKRTISMLQEAVEEANMEEEND